MTTLAVGKILDHQRQQVAQTLQSLFITGTSLLSLQHVGADAYCCPQVAVVLHYCKSPVCQQSLCLGIMGPGRWYLCSRAVCLTLSLHLSDVNADVQYLHRKGTQPLVDHTMCLHCWDLKVSLQLKRFFYPLRVNQVPFPVFPLKWDSRKEKVILLLILFSY